MSAQRALSLLALLVSACGDRGCAVKAQRATALSDRDEPRLSPRALARCRAEVSQSAVAIVSGTGTFESLHATCDRGELSAWVVRGHTLSRTQRSVREGSSWTPSAQVASAVEGLSVLASSVGPIAWRSPTAAIDEMQSEEWWALTRATVDAPWTRATLGFTRAMQSRGLIAAIDSDGASVNVLASVVGEDDREPRVVRVPIGASAQDAEAQSTQDQPLPARLVDGELRAFSQLARVALVQRVEREGPNPAMRIEAYRVEGSALRSLGSHVIASGTVIVTAQGAGTRDEAAFTFGSFARARPQERGCLAVGEGLCVRPGPLLFARIEASATGGAAMRVREIAAEGLADSIAIEPDGRGYVVLYVGVERGQPVQRAARIALDGTLRESWPLRARGLPPIDRPVLVTCDREQWLVGEALVGEPDDDGGAQESGVIAVPLECVRE